MIEIEVAYYAILREQRGLGNERITTNAQSPRDLYAELQAEHGFTLPLEVLRCAVGDDFVDLSCPLRAGDHVTFIPPVAGG